MSAAIVALGVVLWRLAPDGTIRHVSDNYGHILPRLALVSPIGQHICQTLVPEDGPAFEHDVLHGHAATASYRHMTRDGRDLAANASILRTHEPRTQAVQEILLVERVAISPATATAPAMAQRAAVEAEVATLHALTSYHTDILFQLRPTSLTVLARTIGDGRDPPLLTVGASILQAVHSADRTKLIRAAANLGVETRSALLRVRLRSVDRSIWTEPSTAPAFSMWSLSLCPVLVDGTVESINGVARRINRSAVGGTSNTGTAAVSGRRSRTERRPGDSPSAASLRGNRTVSLPVFGTGHTGLMASAHGGSIDEVDVDTAAELANLAPCFSEEALYLYGSTDDVDESASVPHDGSSSGSDTAHADGMLARADTWPAGPTGDHEIQAAPPALAPEEESPFEWLRFGDLSSAQAAEDGGVRRPDTFSTAGNIWTERDLDSLLNPGAGAGAGATLHGPAAPPESASGLGPLAPSP